MERCASMLTRMRGGLERTPSEHPESFSKTRRET